MLRTNSFNFRINFKRVNLESWILKAFIKSLIRTDTFFDLGDQLFEKIDTKKIFFERLIPREKERERERKENTKFLKVNEFSSL